MKWYDRINIKFKEFPDFFSTVDYRLEFYPGQHLDPGQQATIHALSVRTSAPFSVHVKVLYHYSILKAFPSGQNSIYCNTCSPGYLPGKHTLLHLILFLDSVQKSNKIFLPEIDRMRISVIYSISFYLFCLEGPMYQIYVPVTSQVNLQYLGEICGKKQDSGRFEFNDHVFYKAEKDLKGEESKPRRFCRKNDEFLFIECVHCPRHCAQHLTFTIAFILHTIPVNQA